MAEKTKYLGYHLVFECQEGFDVPLTALEKRHHRMRHRNEAKPFLHGAHLTARRHGKAHLLSRHHSWPQFSEDVEEEKRDSSLERPVVMKPEDIDDQVLDNLGPLNSNEVVSADWPPLRLAQRETQVEGSSMYVEQSDATSQSSLSVEQPQCSELAEATPQDATFAGRLLANSAAVNSGFPRRWPHLKKLPPPLPPPMREGDIELREVGRCPVAPDVAEAASRCLQKLVSDHIAKSGDISFGQMVGLLKYAVELGNKRLTKPSSPLSVEEPEVEPELLFGQVAVNLDGKFDARGKGWMRSHKASLSFKAQEKVLEKQEQRLQQQRLEQHRQRSPPFAEAYHLGQSWQVNDKRRSKQHGGHLRFRRGRIGWVEE